MKNVQLITTGHASGIQAQEIGLAFCDVRLLNEYSQEVKRGQRTTAWSWPRRSTVWERCEKVATWNS